MKCSEFGTSRKSFSPPPQGAACAEDGLTVHPRAFWMVCLTVFIDSLGGSISAPVLPFYAKEFNCTSGEVGMLFSSFSLAQVVFLPVLGKLSDTFGRRTVLVGSLFGAAIGAWAQGLAPTYGVLVLARVISGACGAVGSTANVYVSDITTEAARGQYLGYLMNSNGAAFAFGPGLGGGLSRLGLNLPIEVNGTLCLVAGALALKYLPESPVFVRHQQMAAQAARLDLTEEHERQTIPAAVWAVCVVEFLRGISFSAIFALYGLFALEIYQMDSLHIGYVVCVGALTLICTNFFLMCPLQRVLGQVGSAAAGVTVMAVGELVLAFAPCLQVSLLGVWSVYMGQAIAGSNIAAITSMLATDDNRGEVMSMQQMAQAMGRVIGPICLGQLSDTNPRMPFAIASTCVLLAALILLSVRGAYMRRIGIEDLQAPLLPSPPRPAVEDYTHEDVLELGTYLCDLLTEGGYRWHEEDQRQALKKALAVYFPPLGPDTCVVNAEPPDAVRREPTQSSLAVHNPMQPVASVGAEFTITGDDSNFLRSPQIGRQSSLLGAARPRRMSSMRSTLSRNQPGPYWAAS